MTTKEERIRNLVLLGAGNMAEALVRGLIGGGVCFPEDILVTDVRPERITFFQKEFGVAGAVDNAGAAAGAGVLVLAVKPQQMDAVLDGIRGTLNRRALVLSIAAGITTARLEQQLGAGLRVVRAMPNMPALVRAGAAALCGGRWATAADLATAERILDAVGITVRVPEADMDAVTALSGSGPAYVFYLLEAMLEAARHMGLSEPSARRLAHATVVGAARLVHETGLDAAELRERVTSKGGTTAAALEVLGRRGVADAMVEAIHAAWRRSQELSKGQAPKHGQE